MTEKFVSAYPFHLDIGSRFDGLATSGGGTEFIDIITDVTYDRYGKTVQYISLC